VARFRPASTAILLISLVVTVAPSAFAATRAQSAGSFEARGSRALSDPFLKTDSTQKAKFAPSILAQYNPSTGNQLFWVAYVSDNGTNDVLVTNSTNSGATWSAPVNTGQKSKASPSITADSFGDFFIAFVADNSSNDLLLTASTNGGAAWSAGKLVDGQQSKAAPTLDEWFPQNPTSVDQVILSYVADNRSNALYVTTSTDGEGTGWSRGTSVDGESSHGSPGCRVSASGRQFPWFMWGTTRGTIFWRQPLTTEVSPGLQARRSRTAI
jgi:hypothetical protein